MFIVWISYHAFTHYNKITLFRCHLNSITTTGNIEGKHWQQTDRAMEKRDIKHTEVITWQDTAGEQEHDEKTVQSQTGNTNKKLMKVKLM